MEFLRKGFVVVRNAISQEELDVIYPKMLRTIDEPPDNQCTQSLLKYNEKHSVDLHLMLLPKLQEMTGYDLYKTYCYSRIYNKDEVLRIHDDRPACEISATICIGYEGESWPIWILDFDEKPHQVTLNPGDMLIYHGIALKHWRERNKWSTNHVQAFLHYVNKNGQYAWAKDDIIKQPPQ